MTGGVDRNFDGIDDVYTLIDSDNDGVADLYDLDGVDDLFNTMIDIDQDGLSNYRDPDSDGDGILDQHENFDENNDGVVDRLQHKSVVRDPLKGKAQCR